MNSREMLKFGFTNNVVVGSYNSTGDEYSSFNAMNSPDGDSEYDPKSKSAKEAGLQFKKTVKAAKNVIKKSSDFLYVRTRAIGSLERWGPNMNGDGFPMKELAASYGTFVGKGNFIDHKSDDITKIRGLVIDAYLNNDDHCIECLIAVDKKSHRQLARDIETGTVNSVSMGTRVGHSFCSVCQNRARTEKDYCSHIANYKGMKVSHYVQNEAHRNGQWPVHEVNHDLEFIELSWVAVPAFGDAHVLEKIASVKAAVDSNFEETDADKPSVAEDEMGEFAEAQRNHVDRAEVRIPENLKSIASDAACQSDTSCSNDARKANNAQKVRTASEMRRINITNEETTFRRTPNDFYAKGNVDMDGKDYAWWASSSDQKQWNVFLDEDLTRLISAKGQGQMIEAISELVSKNVPSTELIVANRDINLKKVGYFNNGEDSEYMNSKVKDLDDLIASDKWEKTRIYNPKDLEAPSGDIREVEQKAFEDTAKEGPSGPLGKALPKKDETLNHDELKLKKDLRRAYVNWLARTGNK